MCHTHARGLFLTAYGEEWLQASTTTQTVSKLAATVQELEPKQGSTVHQWPSPPPGFAEIAHSLHRDNLPQVVTGIPPELAEEQSPIQMVGSTMHSAQLFQSTTSGAMCIDMITCSMNLVDLGTVPPADNCPIPALQDEDFVTWCMMIENDRNSQC